MAFDINNPYFRTKVLTASPEELRLMLIDGCVRFLADGRAALEAKNFEKVYEHFTNARNILVELTTSLRRDVDPALCDKLEAIYTYVLRLTVDGSFDKDLKKIDEAIQLMEYDRQTWTLLLDKLASEKANAAASAEYTPISVQG
ncbi:MAG: flagellar export chaperone FliS [Phycisphaerae bacterium]|nr:flagellar export chaperone FliS [Phycisphaerae bacterium]